MPYTINHKPSDYICQCGAIVKASYMQKHLLTAKHQRDVVGCENIEVVAHYKYAIIININNLWSKLPQIFWKKIKIFL
jgi:hypothetical protein